MQPVQAMQHRAIQHRAMQLPELRFACSGLRLLTNLEMPWGRRGGSCERSTARNFDPDAPLGPFCWIDGSMSKAIK